MKKLLIALAIATSISSAQAASSYSVGYNTGYNYGYNIGHRQGKKDAYNSVARTSVIIGLVVIAGVIIYEMGYQSRWTVNEKGAVYRF